MQPANGVPLSPYTGVPGWEEDGEEMALAELAAHVPEGGVIVELGAEYGRSAATFCKHAKPSVMIVSIDLFPKDHPQVGDLLAAYTANLIEAGFEERMPHVIQHDSSAAASEWGGGPIDLLFVDADHSYDGVVRDIEAWAPLVAEGGCVAFHDCAHGDQPHALHFEVSRAVDEWEARVVWEYLGQWASLRAYRRPHDDL